MNAMLTLSGELENFRAAAAKLAAQHVLEITPANEGANSRIYRVRLQNGYVALKSYPQRPGDERDRLETEWTTLTFLRAHGVDTVPAPIARDEQKRLMLMEWIEGELALTHRHSEIDQALSFISKILDLSDEPASRQFKLASEACLSAETVVRQITARLDSFEDYRPLTDFLDGIVRPAFSAAKKRVSVELERPQLLEPKLRRLIPADFGFHNTMRQPDGRLRYIDFDYFGWDDPVKLTADFILHPAMQLSDAERAEVARRMTTARAADEDFPARLERHLPLYALRWALILLNPFRRDRGHFWRDNEGRRDTTFSSQAAKARAVLVRGHAVV